MCAPENAALEAGPEIGPGRVTHLLIRVVRLCIEFAAMLGGRRWVVGRNEREREGVVGLWVGRSAGSLRGGEGNGGGEARAFFFIYVPRLCRRRRGGSRSRTEIRRQLGSQKRWKGNAIVSQTGR